MTRRSKRDRVYEQTVLGRNRLRSSNSDEAAWGWSHRLLPWTGAVAIRTTVFPATYASGSTSRLQTNMANLSRTQLTKDTSAKAFRVRLRSAQYTEVQSRLTEIVKRKPDALDYGSVVGSGNSCRALGPRYTRASGRGIGGLWGWNDNVESCAGPGAMLHNRAMPAMRFSKYRLPEAATN